ncbi:MAG: hypothetical protein KVP17_000071 [Porospora cf. gigantea B]|uniref:uncharacterized protein n=2 Tax=Porospora cf. gigantea B TaxID=2853592 RepID=UPI003571F866|nr:MAG: hypothetical protein KVP17_000071 [Porospora cf. gigantea B]
MSKQRVAYFYDTDVGSYYYGSGHPMKPQRMRMTHALILGYDLYKDMAVYRPHRAIEPEITQFHDGEYVSFLAEVSGDAFKDYAPQLKKFNVGDATDCPVFEGLYDFQRSCAGASIDGAMKLNHMQADVCVNWSGGLHHAKRAEASGFCYLNDIVLAILELLKYHARVMYIDIDIHHGDGVEEAFFVSHRVMTVSFHKFGDFFPGTGDVTDVGSGSGKYYALNVPLGDGVTDEAFLRIFKTTVDKAVTVYQPGAIVLQCGADSVAGDRLGRFNLSIKGHAECVRFVQSKRIPLLVLGGGGYTIRNVARTWAFESAVILNRHADLSDAIPPNEYYEYFAPEYNLHLPLTNMANVNTPEDMEALTQRLLSNLSMLEHAPGVHFAYAPPDFFQREVDDDDRAQHEVHDEGGGLAAGSRPLSQAPHLLRRPDDNSGPVDQEMDRDQKAGLEMMQVGAAPRPRAD